MQIVHERCCGIDVHKKSVVVCVLITREDGTLQGEIRSPASTRSLGLSLWQRLVPRCPVSLLPSIWHLGLECVLETDRAEANDERRNRHQR